MLPCSASGRSATGLCSATGYSATGPAGEPDSESESPGPGPTALWQPKPSMAPTDVDPADAGRYQQEVQ
jgi:hypothetical protein